MEKEAYKPPEQRSPSVLFRTHPLRPQLRPRFRRARLIGEARRNTVMKDLMAFMFAVVAIWFLRDLRRPFDQRAARWGKRGIGPKMSVISIIAVSLWLACLAGAMLAPRFMPRVPPDVEIVVVFGGFCVALAC